MPKYNYVKLPKLSELKKYRISTIRGWLKANLYSPKDREKIRKILPKSSKSLAGQWWDMRAKYGKQVRKQAYEEYYKEIRRAKRKLARLKREGTIIKPPELFLGIGTYMHNEGDTGLTLYKMRRKLVKSILRRNYVRKHNEVQKWKLYQNIIQTFNYSEEAYRVANIFMELSSVEINNYFKKYKGFQKVLYGSPRSILEYMKVATWKLEDLKNTLLTYIKERKIKIG